MQAISTKNDVKTAQIGGNGPFDSALALYALGLTGRLVNLVLPHIRPVILASRLADVAGPARIVDQVVQHQAERYAGDKAQQVDGYVNHERTP